MKSGKFVIGAQFTCSTSINDELRTERECMAVNSFTAMGADPHPLRTVYGGSYITFL